MQQTNDQIATQNFDIVRSMAEAKGHRDCRSRRRWVGGNSFANILSDFEMREGFARGNNDYNYKVKTQQIADENEQAHTRPALRSVRHQPDASSAQRCPVGRHWVTACRRWSQDRADAYGVFDKRPDQTTIDPTPARRSTDNGRGANMADPKFLPPSGRQLLPDKRIGIQPAASRAARLVPAIVNTDLTDNAFKALGDFMLPWREVAAKKVDELSKETFRLAARPALKEAVDYGEAVRQGKLAPNQSKWFMQG